MRALVVVAIDKAQDMVNEIAAGNPPAFLSRVGCYAGVLIVACAYCREVTTFKDGAGAPGGLSHTICPTCGIQVAADFALSRARMARN